MWHIWTMPNVMNRILPDLALQEQNQNTDHYCAGLISHDYKTERPMNWQRDIIYHLPICIPHVLQSSSIFVWDVPWFSLKTIQLWGYPHDYGNPQELFHRDVLGGQHVASRRGPGTLGNRGEISASATEDHNAWDKTLVKWWKTMGKYWKTKGTWWNIVIFH